MQGSVIIYCSLPCDCWVYEVKAIIWSHYWIFFHCFSLMVFWLTLLNPFIEGNKTSIEMVLMCRVGFGNEKINSHVDWTLGSFIIETMGEPLELEHIDTGMIVGNESVTYFSLFAFLFLIILAAFFVMQWRKPQLKTVYDLEKGHYIVTRIRRWYCILCLEFVGFSFSHLSRACKIMCVLCSSKSQKV